MSLGTRLLPSGPSTFPDPYPPVSLTSPPEGAWTHASSPKAVQDNGVIYFGYVDMGNGNIEVRKFTIATATVSSAFVLHAALQVDNHAAPSLWIRSDGRLMAVYCAHDDSVLRTRLTTNVLPDISAWDAEVTFDPGGTSYTYPTIFNVGVTVLLFFRDWQGGNTGCLAFVSSTDEGVTWSAQAQLYKSAGRSSYWMITTDGARADIAITDGRNPPDSGDVPIYHFYGYNAVWYKSNGVAIAGSQPYDPSDLTLVYDSADGMGWPQGIGYNSAGRPTFAYAVLDVPTSNSYRRATWTGSAWVNTTIADSDGVIEGDFAPNVILDWENTDQAYAGIKVGAHWEMYRFTTADDGATWQPLALTTGSTVDNFAPAPIIDNDGRYRIVWLAGAYTDYLNNSMGVMAGR